MLKLFITKCFRRVDAKNKFLLILKQASTLSMQHKLCYIINVRLNKAIPAIVVNVMLRSSLDNENRRKHWGSKTLVRKC